MRKLLLLSVIVLSACGSSVQTSDDGRIVFTEEVQRQLIQEMNETGDCSTDVIGGELRGGDPTVTVPYSNEEVGFSTELPFNPEWGTTKYQPLPYEEYRAEDGKIGWVAFGPMMMGEGCGFGRWWGIGIQPLKGLQEVAAEADVQRQAMFPEGEKMPDELKARFVKIGDYDAVEFIAEGLCSIPTVVVNGPTKTYTIQMTCGGDASDFPTLEKIVEEMKFM